MVYTFSKISARFVIINWLKTDVDLSSRVVIEHPRIKSSMFAKFEPHSDWKNCSLPLSLHSWVNFS